MIAAQGSANRFQRTGNKTTDGRVLPAKFSPSRVVSSSGLFVSGSLLMTSVKGSPIMLRCQLCGGQPQLKGSVPELSHSYPHLSILVFIDLLQSPFQLFQSRLPFPRQSANRLRRSRFVSHPQPLAHPAPPRRRVLAQPPRQHLLFTSSLPPLPQLAFCQP